MSWSFWSKCEMWITGYEMQWTTYLGNE
jgi:hypothetical protein